MLEALKKITKYTEFALAGGILGILLVLVLPIPKVLLDILLVFSISTSIIILMTTLFIGRPLELSTFPTILLVTTMMRLSLNIASTRLILSEGHNGTFAAGRVIEAFGHFVMQGNVVIGIIVFMILTVINFIVITKGSGRIAEVAARFSLDSMPGKQMAIDADLSAGLINEEQARTRRKQVEEESTFYGAMDGANKFVRGDAIAGIIITFINLIGGMIIGVVQKNLSFNQAVQTYTMLTIGEGLVSQVPSLIISLGAGLLVTKSGGTGSADKAIFGQLSSYPQPLWMSSAATFLMGALPGIPFTPFFVLSVITGGIAYLLQSGVLQKWKTELLEQQSAKNMQAESGTGSSGTSVRSDTADADAITQQVSQSMTLDVMRIELGYGLINMVTGVGQTVTLPERIKDIRNQIAKDFGFVMPAITIKDNIQLDQNSYVIKIKEIETGHGSLEPDHLLVVHPKGEDVDIEGKDTIEPAFGIRAKWIKASMRKEAIFRGYTVVDPMLVVVTHLTQIIKDHMPELLSYTETQKLIDNLKDENQKLVKEIIPEIATVSLVQKVLQNLLSELVSIRDFPTILEAIGDAAKTVKNGLIITEIVRNRLSRQISYSNTHRDGYIPVLVLSSFWDQSFSKNIVGDQDNKYLAMQPSLMQQFIDDVKKGYQEQETKGYTPVLLTSPAIRPFVKSVMNTYKPSIVVMSRNEVYVKSNIRTLGVI